MTLSRTLAATRLAVIGAVALAAALPAHASSQLLWSYDSFGDSVAATDGWGGGYTPDRWAGFDYGGEDLELTKADAECRHRDPGFRAILSLD